MKVAVFCASAEGTPEPYVRAAQDLGRGLGERGWGLVFGGFETGLMGTVARSAREAGASVAGVLPCRAAEMPGRPVFACDELIEAHGMADRKAQMNSRSDGFVALPGSFGTLDEFYTVLSEQKLMGGCKPIVLLNVDGFYDPLAQLDARMLEDGLMRSDCAELYKTCTTVEEALDYIGMRAGLCAPMDTLCS